MPKLPKNKLPKINFSHEKIGKNIAQIRKSKNLTQRELAEKIGISRTTIADYERSKTRIYDEMLVRLSMALNVTPDEILCFKNNNSSNITPSLRIMKRLYKIEKLDSLKQKKILSTLDDLIKANS
jgi:transcriptional regulator with XRE-family HTH domain